MKRKPTPPKYLVVSNGWNNEWNPDIDSGHKSVYSATDAILYSNEEHGDDETYVYELRLVVTPKGERDE